MTSSIPNTRYAEGLRRLGFDRDAPLFFDEHVTADAVHETIGCWSEGLISLLGDLTVHESDVVGVFG